MRPQRLPILDYTLRLMADADRWTLPHAPGLALDVLACVFGEQPMPDDARARIFPKIPILPILPAKIGGAGSSGLRPVSPRRKRLARPNLPRLPGSLFGDSWDLHLGRAEAGECSAVLYGPPDRWSSVERARRRW